MEPSYVSWYRDTEVDFSPDTIREVLGLPTERQDIVASKRVTSLWDPPTYHDLMEDIPEDVKREMKTMLIRPVKD